MMYRHGSISPRTEAPGNEGQMMLGGVEAGEQLVHCGIILQHALAIANLCPDIQRKNRQLILADRDLISVAGFRRSLLACLLGSLRGGLGFFLHLFNRLLELFLQRFGFGLHRFNLTVLGVCFTFKSIRLGL